MCSSEKEDPGAGDVTYDSAQTLLAAIAPGMDLCADFTGWAVAESMQPGEDGQAGFIVGRKHADNCLVHVPPEVVIASHGAHCVRIDRARATIDRQGWEAAPSHGSRM